MSFNTRFSIIITGDGCIENTKDNWIIHSELQEIFENSIKVMENFDSLDNGTNESSTNSHSYGRTNSITVTQSSAQVNSSGRQSNSSRKPNGSNKSCLLSWTFLFFVCLFVYFHVNTFVLLLFLMYIVFYDVREREKNKKKKKKKFL